MRSPIISGIVEVCKNINKEFASLDSLTNYCQTLVKQNQIEVVSLSLFLYYVYIRENVFGPSVYTEYVEDTLAPLVKGGPLPDNELDPISYKNEVLQNLLLKFFEKDGEQLYHKS